MQYSGPQGQDGPKDLALPVRHNRTDVSDKYQWWPEIRITYDNKKRGDSVVQKLDSSKMETEYFYGNLEER